ncbi:MAG: hypothetical protein ACLR2E_03975 [Lachnospiraceae bacterium]
MARALAVDPEFIVCDEPDLRSGRVHSRHRLSTC